MTPEQFLRRVEDFVRSAEIPKDSQPSWPATNIIKKDQRQVSKEAHIVEVHICAEIRVNPTLMSLESNCVTQTPFSKSLKWAPN